MKRFMTGWMGAAVVATTLATAGTGYAAGFNGCVNLTNGKLRKLTIDTAPAPTCSSREAPVFLDNNPPDGGPDGPSDGVGTCDAEEVAGTAQANTFAVTHGSCSSGRKIASAGAIWSSPFDAANNGPFYIFPRAGTNGNTWTLIPYNETGVVQTYKFVLWCCEP